MKTRTVLAAAVLAAGVSHWLFAAADLTCRMVANPDFNQGKDQPKGWTLSGGRGRWVDREVLEVSGTGKDSNFWRSACNLAPGELYHFEFCGRRGAGTGSAITGPSSANHDWPDLGSQWQWRGHVFRTPDNLHGETVRLGQWHATGTIQFGTIRLRPTLPVHRESNGLTLGEGESIHQGKYLFHGVFDKDGTNYHRTLVRSTAGFNSNRWSLGGDSQLVYRFGLPGYRFTSARANVNVNYQTHGGCLLEVSHDQSHWRTLASRQGVGQLAAEVPGELLPAEMLFLRLRGSDKQSSFQIDQVNFEANLSGTPPEASGKTEFADVDAESPDIAIRQIVSREVAGRTEVELLAQCGPRPCKLSFACRGLGQLVEAQQRQLSAGQSATFVVPLSAQSPGEHRLKLELKPEGGSPAAVSLLVRVPEYYRADYGELLWGADVKTAVWWCDATRKIPRQRGLPQAKGQAASLAAARNDWEAVQIVVRPTETLRGLKASAGPLSGPGGAVIPAANIRILRIYYHFVDHPTDRTGVRDFWPDALPPLSRPVEVAAGQNQPLWLLIHVPADARPGDYDGRVQLAAEGWSAVVPLRLHVWNFALPATNHLQTAWGLSPGMIFRYHQLKTEADKRRVLDMYLQSFAEHRISPQDSTPLDRIPVKFLPEANPPRAEVDFSAFDAAMARAIERFHFTNFSLPVQGMGGGTFHDRVEPRIGKYTEATPQYQAMFASYAKQLEDHLRAKGWLEMAYVYWFDEPAPKDFDFVRNGMTRLKKYAPSLIRMLTQEPVEELAGAVDLWCPVSQRYDHEMAQKRRAKGERFWWYVCCGPKAPYCTLFIDHPATDLRVWLWQTWQRGIVGNLVWESNYWTSEAAYPDRPQNPYEDPMGYVSGYSTPRGVKRYWGNGDGRFIYPPESAAVPGASGPGPVIDPPVSSIRWEMLREGIEDYECLYLLRDLVAKHRAKLPAARLRHLEQLLEVPAAITHDMTTFTTDPTPVYARRAEIAQAIEELIQ